MLPISGLFEIAIRVKDLARAEVFYRDLLGFTEGLRDESRNWLFLWIAGRQGMIVLQEDKGDWPPQHFAFAVYQKDLAHLAAALKEKGIAVSESVHHHWMNSISLYFEDPDGHDLEFIAARLT